MQSANFFQGTGNAFGLSGELHRTGVGQIFTLPTNPGFDHAAKKQTDITNHHQAKRHTDDRRGVFTAKTPVHENFLPDQRHHHNAEQQAHELDIQTHIAI